MKPAVTPSLTFARGFSLTEMAVVLVIVALLIAGMMLPLSAQQDIRARQETERTLKDVQEALLGFAVTNGRLPCPANLASNGFETPVGGVCACVSPDCFLPAATLGIAPINAVGQALDGWQNPIRYAVTTVNTSAFTTGSGMKNAWGSLAPDLQICATGACANQPAMPSRSSGQPGEIRSRAGQAPTKLRIQISIPEPIPIRQRTDSSAARPGMTSTTLSYGFRRTSSITA